MCCWQDVDAGSEPYSEATHLSLREAQRCFEELGACDPEWVGIGRAPEPDEARDPDWLALDAWEARQRPRVLQAIEAGFGHLRRGRGMRIYDAELADSYGVESEHSRRVEHLYYDRYDEVPDEIIAAYYWVLSFFDPDGLRFHLAAYMAWAVRDRFCSPSNSVDWTIYALCPSEGDTRDWSLARLEVLDRAQAEAVVGFLELMAADERADQRVAREGLVYWRARLEALAQS